MTATFWVGKPPRFDAVIKFAERLQDGEPVVLNFAAMDADRAQRAVDFLAGACLAIGGESRQIANDIFLFTSPTTTITTTIAEVA